MSTTVMRAPRSLDLEITAQCNLRCRYCYFFNNAAVEYRDMPTDAWLKFFDELGSLGVMELTLAGGEPFYRQDLCELLDGIIRNRMRFALLSNGGLIDDDIAAYLAQTKRCNYVQISLDGSRAETHDAARGKGSWEGAVRGIRTLQRNGVRMAVRLTIHHYNVDDLENAARFLLEDLGLAGFGTNSAGYLGNCQRHADEMMLTTEERQRAMDTLTRLNQKYDGRINAAAGPLAEDRMWHKMEQARADRAPAFSNGGHLTACCCTFSKIAIRADGAIVPCNMLPHIVLGYINRDSLQDIWQTAPALNDLRTRHSIPLSSFEFCKGCAYQPYCTGNCPGLAYTLTGQVNHPSPDACLRKFLADGGGLPYG
jgi:SynChlorMet cassette radical SAM/SPASM protein ScmE